ncbi:hypothetical protein GCM10010964_32040 [Caldovatus sediminis]|jgi:hypothetical protein|uniref:DUF1178 family protein n=1 Tax=Caldovatus sediminis TaxID=2041189 RepID=A0A8J2ZDJ1_9PROT|nr:DUF1178 family protein [Caldovatus sediminis]GGG42151.1 hypothetical protein GCM10010964_32040 [Caldovatus sediminis]
MIHYQLRCESSADGGPHTFDGWFKDSAAFEKLARAGMVECPVCGGTKVSRALMAPAIAKAPGVKGRPEALPPPAPAAAPPPAPPAPRAAAAGPLPAQVLALLQRIRAEVERNCDYVGREFAEEARKLHRQAQEGTAGERRGIYGEATEAEAEALREEGIAVARIPWVPPADA